MLNVKVTKAQTGRRKMCATDYLLRPQKGRPGGPGGGQGPREGHMEGHSSSSPTQTRAFKRRRIKMKLFSTGMVTRAMFFCNHVSGKTTEGNLQLSKPSQQKF